MLVPKSYRVQHKILVFLSRERTRQQIENNPLRDCQFTIDQISENINEPWSEVDQQLNLLWYDKLVLDVPGDSRKSPSLFMVSPEGQAVASSMKILNDGKMFNASLFNNLASGLFQIAVGITAILTIVFNFTTMDNLKSEVTRSQQKLENIEEQLIELTKDDSIEKNASDTTESNQTKSQILDNS